MWCKGDLVNIQEVAFDFPSLAMSGRIIGRPKPTRKRNARNISDASMTANRFVKQSTRNEFEFYLTRQRSARNFGQKANKLARVGRRERMCRWFRCCWAITVDAAADSARKLNAKLLIQFHEMTEQSRNDQRSTISNLTRVNRCWYRLKWLRVAENY